MDASAAGRRASSGSRKERDSGEAPSPPSESSQQPEVSSSSLPSPRAVGCSPLHYNIEEFIKRVALTEDEKRVKQECIEWSEPHFVCHAPLTFELLPLMNNNMA